MRGAAWTERIRCPFDSLRLAILLLLVPAACVCAQSAQTKGSDAGAAADRAAESSRVAIQEVKRFEYVLASDRDKELNLTPSPVHRYTHQHNGEVYTNLFVWTHKGRPEAIASISNWFSPRRYHGLAVTSLSTEKLIGMRDGEEIWHPKSAGIEFKPIPKASAPAESAVQRLRQMRSLAREFTAEFKRESRKPESGKLRLLSTPLFRYQPQDSKVIDGAIFGLASGTSPQLVLLIEARNAVPGIRWEYALAPRNSFEYRAFHKDRRIWSLPQLAPPWANSKDPTNTYTVFPDLQREGRTQEFVDQLLKFNRILEKTSADGS
jgi:hypothetical protein